MDFIIQKTNTIITVTNNVTDDLSNTLTAFDVPNYYDIIYNKTHVIKSRYSAGSITTEVKFPLEIWNTYTVNKNINDINYNAVSGVRLYNKNGSEIEVGNLLIAKTSSYFDVVFSTSGDGVVDGNIELNISGLIVPIHVTATRSFIFDYEYNMATKPVENYGFVTEVLESIDSSETRYSYIYNARYDFTNFYTLTDSQKRKMEATLYSGATGVLSVPVYTQSREAEIVGDILHLDIKDTSFQLGMAVLVKDYNKKDTAKITEIIAGVGIRIDKLLVDFDYPMVYPLLSVRLDAATDTSNLTSVAGNFSLTFEKDIDDIDMLVTNNNTTINYINGLPLLEYIANTNSPIDIKYFRNVIKFDNGISKRDFKVNNKVAKVQTTYNYILEDSDKISYIKNFFNQTQGMFKEFYCFTNKQEFLIVDNILSSDTILTIANENVTSSYKNNYIKYIAIFYNDTYKIFEITNIYEIDQEREAISISIPFGINLNKEDVAACQFVVRSRFSSDILSLEYETNEVANMSVSSIKLTKE